MDWLDTAYTLMKRFNDRTPGLREGMAAAIRALAPRGTDAEQKKLARISWAGEVKPFADWVAASVKVNRLPDEVAGLWFSVPELDLNAPLIYFIGSRSFTDVSGRHWARADWTQDRRPRRAPRHREEFPSRVLRGVQLALNFGPGTDPEPEEFDRLRPLIEPLPQIYTGLLLRHALVRDPRRLLGGREWRGVGFGYVSGDQHIAGVLTAEGWVKPGKRFRFEYKEQVKRLHPVPHLDLNSTSFDAAAYLKAGLDLNATDAAGRTPLMRVLVLQREDVDWALARRIILAGANVASDTKYGTTPLHLSMRGPRSIRRLLLQRGASPNFINRNGYAPMHTEVKYNADPQTVRMMLEHGGDPNLKGLAGRRPLHWLADYGEPTYEAKPSTGAVIRLLLAHGADLEAKDARGATPLMHAVIRFCEYHRSDNEHTRGGHDVVAIRLLRAGADPDCRIKTSPHPLLPDGGTPLMCRRYSPPDLHLALLRHGADPKAKSKERLTALDYARQAAADEKRPDRDAAAKVASAIERALKRRSRASPAGGRRNARRSRAKR